MPKCVLLVDDDAIVREIIQRTFQHEAGFEILTARNGLEALEVLKTRTPNLILLDVQMPEMDGYGFIVEKSKVSAFDSIPVIVLTSLDTLEPLFKRHGVKAYLTKPVDLKRLLDKVKSFVSN